MADENAQTQQLYLLGGIEAVVPSGESGKIPSTHHLDRYDFANAIWKSYPSMPTGLSGSPTNFKNEQKKKKVSPGLEPGLLASKARMLPITSQDPVEKISEGEGLGRINNFMDYCCMVNKPQKKKKQKKKTRAYSQKRIMLGSTNETHKLYTLASLSYTILLAPGAARQNNTNESFEVGL
jgi:hypothetical protein